MIDPVPRINAPEIRVMPRRISLVLFVLLFASQHLSEAQFSYYSSIIQIRHTDGTPGTLFPANSNWGFGRNKAVSISATLYKRGVVEPGCLMQTEWKFPSGPTTISGTPTIPGVYVATHPRIGWATGDPTLIYVTVHFTRPNGVLLHARTFTFTRIP